MKRFLAGLFVGGAVTFLATSIDFVRPSPPTPAEISLAQYTLDTMEPYIGECRLETVFSLMQELQEETRERIDAKELYAPLVELATKHAERRAACCLQKAEQFLDSVKQKPDVISIVEDRVYVEILEQGSGEKVNSKDSVVIHFQEYDLDGTLLKDTRKAKSFTIPLPQTVKGFQLSLAGAKVGERRKIYIHPEYGFGKPGKRIPNQLLIYEVQILDKK